MFQELLSVAPPNGLTLGCSFSFSKVNSLALECVNVNIEWKLLLSGPVYLIVLLGRSSSVAALSKSYGVHLAIVCFGVFLPYRKFSLDLH